MANNSGSNSRMCVQKEATWNTNAITTAAIQAFFESEDIKRTREYAEDNSNLGKRIRSGKYPTYLKVDGSFNFNAYPEFGNWLLYFLMGKIKGSVVTAPKGSIFITYTGASAAATLENSSDVLTAKLNGVADTNFNTTGSLDMSAATFDTLTELAAAIDGYTGYTAFVIGDGSSASTGIADFAATSIKKQTIKLDVAGAVATYYQHTFQPVGSADSLPSFSICRDDTVSVTTFTGAKGNELSLEMTPGEVLKGSLSVIGGSFESDTYPAITVTDSAPYVVKDKIKVYIDGTEQLNIANATLTISNGLTEGDKILGASSYGESQTQTLTATLSGEFFWNSTTSAFVTGYDQGTSYEIIVAIEAEQNIDVANSIPYRMFFRLPKAKITEGQVNIGGADRLTMPFTFEAEDADISSPYEPVEMQVFSTTADFTA